MFSKSKKSEDKEIVVAPVPIPPKDTKEDKPANGELLVRMSKIKFFTKVAPSVLSSDLKVKVTF